MESLGNKKTKDDIHDDNDDSMTGKPGMPGMPGMEDEEGKSSDEKYHLEEDKELEDMSPSYDEEELPADGLTPDERGQKYKDKGGHEGDDSSMNEDGELIHKGLFNRGKDITIRINLGSKSK